MAAADATVSLSGEGITTGSASVAALLPVSGSMTPPVVAIEAVLVRVPVAPASTVPLRR